MATYSRILFALLVSTAASAPAFAQGRDVDIFFDDRGQRIILDGETGEILAVEPPRRLLRQPQIIRRDQLRERRVLGREIIGGPYDLNDPEDRARFERDREILLGRREAPEPDYREPGFAEPRYREPVYEEEVRPLPRSRRAERELPDYPLERPDGQLDQPEVARRDPIERAPLDAEPSEPGEEPAPPTIAPPEDSGSAVVDPATVPQMPGKGASEEVAKIQVLLDRAGASPGVIDGRMGDNVNKAISAYKEIKGEALRTYDKESIEQELAATGGPAFMDYVIANEDVAGQYVASIPEDYGEKAKLERLGYTRVTEMLAERFHMDEKYLIALNPGVNFERPGTTIKVANTGVNLAVEVTNIVADKQKAEIRAYNSSGFLVAAYPATIGSTDTPSPSGTHQVERVAFDPEYTYNPKINFKQGENDKILTIPPGPNGPVGTIWIALSKPTYGIHGTPEPSKIGKTNSHGCVRLTNWDAQELAKVVKKGVTVEFLE